MDKCEFCKQEITGSYVIDKIHTHTSDTGEKFYIEKIYHQACYIEPFLNTTVSTLKG